LRAVLASAVDDEINGGTAARAAAYREPDDNLGVIRPAGSSVTVELRGSWPGVLGLENNAGRTERDPDEVGECGILLRIERDQQIVRHLPTMADVGRNACTGVLKRS
jgi:hypothetical protein